jgi:hypothetical protein
MSKEEFVFEIVNETKYLCDEFRKAYLYLYGIDVETLHKNHNGFFVDNVKEPDEHNIVFDIESLDKTQFPNINAFKNTYIGKNLGNVAFFTETDTRKGYESSRLSSLDMHKHVTSSVIISFPLSNCNYKTEVGFHKLTPEEELQTHLCEIGGVHLTNNRWYKDPDFVYSSIDDTPYLLRAGAWHSVKNYSNSRRIVSGWYFKPDVIWEDLLELIREERKISQLDEQIPAR